MYSPNPLQRIALNGFGRIGRLCLRALLSRTTDIQIVAIADFDPDPAYWVYLLKHDSVHGLFHQEIAYDAEYLIVGNQKIRCIPACARPTDLPWKELNIDIVIEATGQFTDQSSYGHIAAGAKQVILSAMTTDPRIKTLVLGVNHYEYVPCVDRVISNASCTANCLTPLIHVLRTSGIGFQLGYVTTVLPYTGTRTLVDSTTRKDWRAGRSATLNITPSSVGASKAACAVYPELQGKITDMVYRVPTADVALLSFHFITEKPTYIAHIDRALCHAAIGDLTNIIAVTNEPVVSSDIRGNPHSAIYDRSLTLQQNSAEQGTQFTIVAWYDNEWGYANRLADMTEYLAAQLAV